MAKTRKAPLELRRTSFLRRLIDSVIEEYLTEGVMSYEIQRHFIDMS